MNFENINFIKPNVEFDRNDATYAPMFRKTFMIDEEIKSAVLTVCGLGYGYYYINGEEATKDIFTAPVSDYTKTLWYNRYDVSGKLFLGENIFAVICGNGWYNENLLTAWDYDTAPWRDMPKFILKLEVNGKTVLTSDNTWKYTLQSPVIFNQLRQGEHYDSRLYKDGWKDLDFDDSSWDFAKIDDTPPTGIFRECLCEPIREFENLSPKKIIKVAEDKYVFDFGINISGYTRLKVNQPAGDKLILRHAERINKDNSLNFNQMDDSHFYKSNIFQTNEFICCGKEFTWTPKFCYHGFRYVEVTGLKDASEDTLTAIFVHQAVNTRSSFRCSNENLNKLFLFGQRATLSNMFYGPTDCPTREKLGWMNDAQASCEQFLIDFELERVLSKWWIDICDAMRPDGMLPGIVPTSGWGYEWGNGPVSEGTLFEIPYRIYRHTGDSSLLIQGIPFFKRSIDCWKSLADENGDINYGLEDWAGPYENTGVVDAKFINRVLKVKCMRIMVLASELAGEDTSAMNAEIDADIAEIKRIYIKEDGTCLLNKQTAVALLIYFGIYDNLEPLKNQLKALVEELDFHHDCGMVGMRYLYTALNLCGLADYAFKIITADGFPSYNYWLEDGATTLYERWDRTESMNHHMYSYFMAWLMHTVLGIETDENNPGFEKIDIHPHFFDGLSFAEGHCDTVRGRVAVKWAKKDGRVTLRIDVPPAMDAYYKGEKLETGTNTFEEII